MAIDETAILSVIGVGCGLFAVVSAYLIYKHVQEEKEQVFRASVRREKDQEGPSDYLKNPATSNRKPPIPGPVIVPPSMPVEEQPLVPEPEPVPEPDPVLDPIMTQELPPEPKPHQPTSSNDIELAPIAAAAVPAVVAAGAVAAAANASQSKPPKPPKEKPAESPQSDDFEDYRNFSPQTLPPPKAATPPPPPAQYEPPATPVHVKTESVPAVPTKSLNRAGQSTMDREGLRF